MKAFTAIQIVGIELQVFKIYQPLELLVRNAVYQIVEGNINSSVLKSQRCGQLDQAEARVDQQDDFIFTSQHVFLLDLVSSTCLLQQLKQGFLELSRV